MNQKIVMSDKIWNEIRSCLDKSNCLKTHTSAGLVKGGKVISVGFNLCAPRPSKYGDKLSNCPRMNVKTGTQYELCSPVHAEVMACLNIRQGRNENEITEFASHKKPSNTEISSVFTDKELQIMKGASLYLAGHYWACENCLSFLRVVGINDIHFDDATSEGTKKNYQEKKLM